MHAIYRCAKGNEPMRPLAPFLLAPHTCPSFHIHPSASEFRFTLFNVSQDSGGIKITTAVRGSQDGTRLAAAKSYTYRSTFHFIHIWCAINGSWTRLRKCIYMCDGRVHPQCSVVILLAAEVSDLITESEFPLIFWRGDGTRQSQSSNVQWVRNGFWRSAIYNFLAVPVTYRWNLCLYVSDGGSNIRQDILWRSMTYTMRFGILKY